MNPAGAAGAVSRLAAVADEMGAVLRRAAFSPNIKERADCSAALFTPVGELLAQAEHIPVHLGSMPASVAAAIAADGAIRCGGEQVVLNDPFAGGTHLNDVTVVAPCPSTAPGRLGREPGAPRRPRAGRRRGRCPRTRPSIDAGGPARAAGAARRARCAALIVAASRTPSERAGDLDAQRGREPVGVARSPSSSASSAIRGVRRGARLRRAAMPRRAGRVARRRVDAADVLDSTGPRADSSHPARHPLRGHRRRTTG